jgi:hypothetical protein
MIHTLIVRRGRVIICKPLRWGQLLATRSLKVCDRLDLDQLAGCVRLCALQQTQNNLRGEGLMAVADDGGHAGEIRQLLRRALRIAAGDHDTRCRIPPVRAANEGPRRPVRLGGHAARIDDNDIRFRGRPETKPCSAQLIAHRLAVGARCATAKMLDVEAESHEFSLEELGENCSFYERHNRICVGPAVHKKMRNLTWLDYSSTMRNLRV